MLHTPRRHDPQVRINTVHKQDFRLARILHERRSMATVLAPQRALYSLHDVTPAKGKDFKGCGCVASEFGCCPDNFTPAAGPHFTNCTCHTYEYGCCPNGKSIARGPGQVKICFPRLGDNFK